LDADSESFIQDLTSKGFGPACDYLLDHNLPPSGWPDMGVQFLPVPEICERLGFKKSSKDSYADCGIWLPAWTKDAKQDEEYGHGILFSKMPFGGPKNYSRRRLNPSIEKHATDLIWIPPLDGRTWDQQEDGEMVVACESIIKAWNLRNLDYLAVAINGVFGFTSNGVLVPGFRDDIWRRKRLHLTFCTDSLNTKNANSRKDVTAARIALPSRLVAENVVPKENLRVAEPPDNPEGGDWGLDQMLMHKDYGERAVRLMLKNAPLAKIQDGKEAAIFTISSDFVWVDSLNKGVAMFDNTFMGKEAMANMYAPLTYKGIVPSASGPVEKLSSGFLAWFTSPDRPSTWSVCFRPGEGPRVAAAGTARLNYNLWRGFTAEPFTDEAEKAASLLRFKQFYVDVVLAIYGPTNGSYYLDCMASLIQQPEAILANYAYLYGKGGVGKNYGAYPPMVLMGRHAMGMPLHNYVQPFNAHIGYLRFAAVNEMPATIEPKAQSGIVNLIKEDSDPNNVTRALQLKGVDVKTIDRNLWLNLLGNNLPAYYIDDGTRRRTFLAQARDPRAVLDPDGKKWGNKEAFWKPLWAWMHSEIGARDLMTGLGAWDLKLRGFDPKADALQTEDLRMAMIAGASSSMNAFLAALGADPANTLRACGFEEEVVTGLSHLKPSDALAMFKLVSPTTSISAGAVGRLMTGEFGPSKQHNIKRSDGSTRNESLYQIRAVLGQDNEGKFRALDAAREHLKRQGAMWKDV